MSANRQSKGYASSVPAKSLTTRLTPAVLVLASLTLIAFHRFGTLPIEPLRVAVTDVITPVLSTISKPMNDFIDGLDGFKTMRALKAENIRLTEENKRLQAWYETALKLQAENKSLHALLNVKPDASMSYVTARVVSDPGGAFVKSVLLPVGMGDKVLKGSAVMSGHGLVGRVTEVGRHSSRVLLITDLNSRIPVLIQNTRTKAILAGKNTDLLRLERLPIDSGIEVGQRVVTSGDGGFLPPEIPIGVIVSSGPDGVAVKPLADLDQLGHVEVLSADMDNSLMSGNVTEPDAAESP